jgi:hypothetical protein
MGYDMIRCMEFIIDMDDRHRLGNGDCSDV